MLPKTSFHVLIWHAVKTALIMRSKFLYCYHGCIGVPVQNVQVTHKSPFQNCPVKSGEAIGSPLEHYESLNKPFK